MVAIGHLVGYVIAGPKCELPMITSPTNPTAIKRQLLERTLECSLVLASKGMPSSITMELPNDAQHMCVRSGVGGIWSALTVLAQYGLHGVVCSPGRT